MNLLLAGASDLMTVDTNSTWVPSVVIASVLATKTSEGIQGEECGCRSRDYLGELDP